MSTVRTRSAAKKQPSVKDTNAVTAPTSNVPNGINADPDTPKNPPVRQLSMQRRATQTLTSTAANLANLLPTGTLLAFQLLTPMFTNNGACDSATRTMTLVLLVLLALSCFLASFTDSVKASDGQVYYGFTTFKGLWLFDCPDASGAGLTDLSKYKIRLTDGVHAVLSVLVFGAVTMRDKNVMQCFYPQPAHETQEVLNIVPVGLGIICSLLFMVFPTKRHGIGYPVTSAQQRGHSTGFRVGFAASMATGPGPAEPKSSSSTGSSQKDAASTSVGTEPNSTSSSSTDSQKDEASSSGATEPYSTTSSGSSNPQTDDDLSSETDLEPDLTSPEGSDSPDTTAFYDGSSEKSKRATRRPSRLEDYILY